MADTGDDTLLAIATTSGFWIVLALRRQLSRRNMMLRLRQKSKK